MKDLEKKIRKIYDKANQDILKEVETLYSRYGKEVPQEIYKYNRLEKIKEAVRIDFKDSYKEINTLIELQLIKDVKSAIQTSGVELGEMVRASDKEYSLKGIEFDFDITRIVNSEMSGLNWKERQDYHRATTIKEVQEVLGKGLQQGTRVEVLSKELADRIDVSYNKAMQIVRTESHRAVSQAKLESFQEINKHIPIKKKWLTGGDERVRDSHTALDGVIVEIDEPYIINGYEALAPGLFGEPSLDINCRCVSVMVLE